MNIYTIATIAALIAAPGFGAAQSTSFADRLKAAEAQARIHNQSERLKECLKRTTSDTYMAHFGITDADPENLQDTRDEAFDEMAELLMEAVNALDGDYVAAIEQIILGVVSEGTFGAETAVTLRDGYVACFEVT